MAKNKITNLADMLFIQLENLTDIACADISEMTPEEIKRQKETLELAVRTADTSKGFADSILSISRLQLDAMKAEYEYNLSRNELPKMLGIQ